MEKVVRETVAKDDAVGRDATAAQTPGQSHADRATDGGSSEGSTSKSSSAEAVPDGGWEADYSLLAAMGIVIGPPKPQGHQPGGAGGTAKAGAAAKPSPTTLPGVATPPKGQPQGRVTPEAKKELQNKKEAKEKAPAGGAGGGASAAQAVAGGAGGAASSQQDAAPKAGAAAAAPAPGAQPAPGAVAPGADAPNQPGTRTGDDIDQHNVERLIEMLEHDADPEHRRAAVRALGKLHVPKARAALEKALRDKDPMIARAAEAALAGAAR